MYVDLSNKETKDSRLVAWCKLHEGYLTVKQLRTKQCLQKQCHHLEKIGHSWWRKREKDKQLKKERKRRLMGITAPSIKPNEENVTSLNSLEYLKSCNEDNILLASIVDCLIEIDNEKEIKINNTTSAMNKEKTNKEKEVVEKKNSKSDPHKSLKNFRDKFIILINNLITLNLIKVTGDLYNENTKINNLGMDYLDYRFIIEFHELFLSAKYIDLNSSKETNSKFKPCLKEVELYLKKYKIC